MSAHSKSSPLVTYFLVWGALLLGTFLTYEAAFLDLGRFNRSEEHTSELQSPCNLVCRLLLEKSFLRPCPVSHSRRWNPEGGWGGRYRCRQFRGMESDSAPSPARLRRRWARLPLFFFRDQRRWSSYILPLRNFFST